MIMPAQRVSSFALLLNPDWRSIYLLHATYMLASLLTVASCLWLCTCSSMHGFTFLYMLPCCVCTIRVNPALTQIFCSTLACTRMWSLALWVAQPVHMPFNCF